MNLLRDTLIRTRAAFIVGCVQTLFYLAGFGLLFAAGWQVGLGALLVWWGSMIQSKAP